MKVTLVKRNRAIPAEFVHSDVELVINNLVQRNCRKDPIDD